MFYHLHSVSLDVAWDVETDLQDKTPEQLLNIAYAGLTEEVGEVLGLRKRQLRNRPVDEDTNFAGDAVCCTREKFVEELGDVLWYFAMLCNQLGIDLDELWKYNRDKLYRRYHHE